MSVSAETESRYLYILLLNTNDQERWSFVLYKAPSFCLSDEPKAAMQVCIKTVGFWATTHHFELDIDEWL